MHLLLTICLQWVSSLDFSVELSLENYEVLGTYKKLNVKIFFKLSIDNGDV